MRLRWEGGRGRETIAAAFRLILLLWSYLFVNLFIYIALPMSSSQTRAQRIPRGGGSGGLQAPPPPGLSVGGSSARRPTRCGVGTAEGSARGLASLAMVEVEVVVVDVDVRWSRLMSQCRRSL